MARQDGNTGRGRVSSLVALVLCAALVAAAFLLRGRFSSSADPVRPRNVLLIVSDTTRADRLGCYGYPRPTSPNIDRLALSGTLYRRNYSQACWTVPSMISMMTGRSVVEELQRLPPQAPVLGEALRQSGIETAAFVSNLCLGSSSGFERGFDHYATPGNQDARSVVAEFASWHGARAKSKPWFAWVHFIDPHEPYAPDATHDVFDGPRLDQAELEQRLREAQPEAERLSPPGVGETLTLEQAIARATADSNHYDGEVHSVDAGVGSLLAQLERSGELADTLVIFCADHGEMLYEQRQQPLITQGALKQKGFLPAGVLDLFGHGHRPWYYEPLWNTPLILSGPGMPVHEQRSGLSANLDIFPTVLAAFGLPLGRDLEGTSLLGGREPDYARVFAYGHRTSAIVEKGGLKLMLHPPEMFLQAAGSPALPELHDLQQDPGEKNELSAARAEERQRLVREIEAWRKRSPHYGVVKVSEAQIKALKALGYIDGEH